MQTTILSLNNLNKKFGEQKILKGVSIDIYKGEFITLLGPSGCGKTTTLRAIAGLENIDSGSILLNGQEVSTLEPDKRNVNTVFQNYALFPHMNVYNNIAYGPKIKKYPKGKIKEMVSEMLTLVEMNGFESRMPDQLSGGQRQRIAIARALINRPDIILLDEPLGALDLKLRKHMQTELKQLQKRTGVTFIYVTHDQEEALNMSDRLAIMNEGVLEQIGTPHEVYNSPQTKFVAQFVGERNIIEVNVIKTYDNIAEVEFMGFVLKAENQGYSVGDAAVLCVHTDRMLISRETFEGAKLQGVVISRDFTGSQTKTDVLVGDDNTFHVVEYYVKSEINVGDKVFFGWDLDDGVLIPK